MSHWSLGTSDSNETIFVDWVSDNQVDEIFLKSVVYDNGTHQR